MGRRTAAVGISGEWPDTAAIMMNLDLVITVCQFRQPHDIGCDPREPASNLQGIRRTKLWTAAVFGAA
jgi:hypothetical protein